MRVAKTRYLREELRMIIELLGIKRTIISPLKLPYDDEIDLIGHKEILGDLEVVAGIDRANGSLSLKECLVRQATLPGVMLPTKNRWDSRVHGDTRELTICVPVRL